MYPSGEVNSRREGSLVRTPSLHQKFKKYMLSSLAMLRGLTDYICVLSFATMKILAQRTINAGGNETENRGEGGSQEGKTEGGVLHLLCLHFRRPQRRWSPRAFGACTFGTSEYALAEEINSTVRAGGWTACHLPKACKSKLSAVQRQDFDKPAMEGKGQPFST